MKFSLTIKIEAVNAVIMQHLQYNFENIQRDVYPP